MYIYTYIYIYTYVHSIILLTIITIVYTVLLSYLKIIVYNIYWSRGLHTNLIKQSKIRMGNLNGKGIHR